MFVYLCVHAHFYDDNICLLMIFSILKFLAQAFRSFVSDSDNDALICNITLSECVSLSSTVLNNFTNSQT